MRAVDTNVLVRLIVRDDADQVARAEAFVVQQPVAKVPAAFERRCIPPDCVVRRLHMPNMRPPHALSGGRLAALGATRGFTTGCQGAWVSLPVLVEAAWVLKSVYKLGRQKIGTVMDMLVEHDRLTLQDEDVVRRACALFARERSAGFSDCLIVEAARKAGHAPVGTFDKRMARLDGAQRL